MKPGDLVANKYTGVRFVVVSVKGKFARIQTKPGLRIWSVPVSWLRPAQPVEQSA